MIKIKINKTATDLISGYEINGHAGYAEEGFDIVCAAVSALSLAALNGLTEHLKCEVQYVCSNGALKVELKQTPDQLTEAILVTMSMALLDIAEQYPQRVRIQERRR
ncbi:MAG TPA: ribosomal-processing cysteine protease Prp [Candidatus Avacidaminococcus intestinavium]|uniref:Ribosomal processing cysteine protease Prp n=1 Tax=Candidatus Avacidaminococcus intestinavium TaxID=2840684 RepID=A0A9D1MQU7_9FIRM|nr:ribosomal-processing cysteine protease Prp [Candidatus Avacidaminococcus intestinavium]